MSNFNSLVWFCGECVIGAGVGLFIFEYVVDKIKDSVTAL